jgi:hypothetical protein
MPLSIDSVPASLAADQRLVFENLVRIVTNTREADRRYEKLNAAKGGKVISVDIARFLAPEFRSWDGRIRHTPSTAVPAGAYAHDRLRRELSNRRHADGASAKGDAARGKKPTLLISAGGAGSGKTTLLSEQTHNATLVFDNQLRSFARADELLALATSLSWNVHVLYVHRPFRDVIRGVLERSQRTGRWNALGELAQSHVDAQATIVRLREKYKSKVLFRAYFNISKVFKGDRARGDRVYFFELAKGGCYHLPSAQALRLQVRSVVEASVKQGRISKEFASLLLREDAAT